MSDTPKENKTKAKMTTATQMRDHALGEMRDLAAEAALATRYAIYEQLQPSAAVLAVLGLDMAIERIAEAIAYGDSEAEVRFRETAGWNTTKGRDR